MKIWKHILVFGVPALACGAGWAAGITVWLMLVGRSDIPLAAFQENLIFGVWALFSCFASALVSAFCYRKRWKKASTLSSIGWAALHVVTGATLFGTMISPILGTIFGFLFAFPLMPVQIIGAHLHIRLFRYLHARFLAPQPVG